MEFTVEEMNLMCIYDTGSKASLINGIVNGMEDAGEPELLGLMQSIVDKLNRLTEQEFLQISFSPEFGFEEYEEQEV